MRSSGARSKKALRQNEAMVSKLLLAGNDAREGAVRSLECASEQLALVNDLDRARRALQLALEITNDMRRRVEVTLRAAQESEAWKRHAATD